MARISSSLSEKSNTSRFGARRSRRAVFGIGINPSWRCHRSTTCAGVLSSGTCHLGDHRVAEQAPAFTDRCPRLGDDAMLVVVLPFRLPRHPGIELDLIDVGDHPCLVDESL